MQRQRQRWPDDDGRDELRQRLQLTLALAIPRRALRSTGPARAGIPGRARNLVPTGERQTVCRTARGRKIWLTLYDTTWRWLQADPERHPSSHWVTPTTPRPCADRRSTAVAVCHWCRVDLVAAVSWRLPCALPGYGGSRNPSAQGRRTRACSLASLPQQGGQWFLAWLWALTVPHVVGALEGANPAPGHHRGGWHQAGPGVPAPAQGPGTPHCRARNSAKRVPTGHPTPVCQFSQTQPFNLCFGAQPWWWKLRCSQDRSSPRVWLWSKARMCLPFPGRFTPPGAGVPRPHQTRGQAGGKRPGHSGRTGWYRAAEFATSL